jgi:hypothetical protein
MKKLMFLFPVFFSLTVTGQKPLNNSTDYLYRIWDTIPGEVYGYVNYRGDTVIPFHRYDICYTDTIRNFGIVYKFPYGYIGIDKAENYLFTVFPFDNGPDEPSEGLFRIMENGMIGYADLNGNIVIKPQFDCALPFEDGKAEVSNYCYNYFDGEHGYWESDNWFYIDKKGNKLEK